MKYEKQLVFVRFVGTRTDYDAINVEEVLHEQQRSCDSERG